LAEHFSAVKCAVVADVDFVPFCRKPRIQSWTPIKVGPFDCIPLPVVEVFVPMGARFCCRPPLRVNRRRLVRSGDLGIGLGQEQMGKRGGAPGH
jgi:hypothetical protein